MAIGYALANSIWLEGPEGIVVVDTTESMEAGRAVYNDMRKGIKGPIKAIIYTHSHPDHVYGAKVPSDERLYESNHYWSFWLENLPGAYFIKHD